MRSGREPSFAGVTTLGRFCALFIAGGLVSCDGTALDPNSAGGAGMPTVGMAAGGQGGQGGQGASASASPIGGQGSGLPMATAGTSGQGGAQAGTTCAGVPSIPRRLWRLSAGQYANATRDLLSLAAAPSTTTFPAEPGSSALVGDVSAAVSPAFLYNGPYQTAGTILTAIGPRLLQVAACTTGETDGACATRFAQTFGARAFRRPLAASEVADLMDVYAAGAVTDFSTGIKLMIKALLLAPTFLYRSELGSPNPSANAAGVYPDTTLTPYEVATQLGFTFLDSTPDGPLLAAAGNGGLVTTAGLAAEVTRLMARPEVRTHLASVVSAWFLPNPLADDASKDPALLTALPPAERDQPGIAGELQVSQEQFVLDALWADPSSPITGLLSSQKVFVNRRLATLYNLPFALPPPADGFVADTWPADQTRMGLLTQPAYLWSSAPGSRVNIVQRGKFIHEQVLCQPSPPPIDLTSAEALRVMTMGDSEATRSDARLASGKLCAENCHAEIDPYGRLLLEFDAIGKYRTMDDAGRPIAPTVTVPASYPLGASAMVGRASFVGALTSTHTFANCAVEKMVTHAIGRGAGAASRCELDDVKGRFARSDGTASALFGEIAAARVLNARAGGTR